MTAQQLYNKYCKCELSAAQFIQQLHKDPLLKEYISPFNTVVDTVLILKQRGVISQQFSMNASTNIKEEFEDNVYPEKGDKPSDLEIGEEKKDEHPHAPQEPTMAMADRTAGTYRGTYNPQEGKEQNAVKETAKRYLKMANGSRSKAIELCKHHIDQLKHGSGDKNLIRGHEQVIDYLSNNELHEAKKQNQYGQVAPLKQKKKLTADDVNYYEFTRGWRQELEKTDDIDKAKEIAIKNLAKDPMYYSKQLMGITSEKARTDVMKNIDLLGMKKNPSSQNDKPNQMAVVKNFPGNLKKANTKNNLGNQERAKGAPKGVKTMKLKESLRDEIRAIIEADSSMNNHLQAMRDMVKMDPEKLADDVLRGFDQMGPMHKKFAGKVLGKHIADGNKSQKVAQAFHKISDKVKETNPSKYDTNYAPNASKDYSSTVKEDAEKIEDDSVQGFVDIAKRDPSRTGEYIEALKKVLQAHPDNTLVKKILAKLSGKESVDDKSVKETNPSKYDDKYMANSSKDYSSTVKETNPSNPPRYAPNAAKDYSHMVAETGEEDEKELRGHLSQLLKSGGDKGQKIKVLSDLLIDKSITEKTKAFLRKLLTKVRDKDVDKKKVAEDEGGIGNDKIKAKAASLLKAAGSQEKAIAYVKQRIKDIPQEFKNKPEFAKRLADGYTKVLALLVGGHDLPKDIPLKADLKSFIPNEGDDTYSSKKQLGTPDDYSKALREKDAK